MYQDLSTRRVKNVIVDLLSNVKNAKHISGNSLALQAVQYKDFGAASGY